MHLWIVTIGSSDVQLISNEANQAKGRTEKQRSNKVWSYWYTDALKADCYDISFEPKQAFSSKDEAYRIPPRILGRVYQASDESGQKEIRDYLTFPLLDNFVQVLNNYPTPEAIAVLLTDQSTIFESERQRKPNSPYWQDTCELQPILQSYFTANFPDSVCDFISLTPNSEDESLENWNSVLDLVREKFHNLTIASQPIQVNLEENVYVSHQAGTPAISSAVQFCSLATFGDRVKFLVSSEYNRTLPEKPLEGSSYLRGIRIQEAKALLTQYDYVGVRDILSLTNIVPNTPKEKQIKILLDAGEQWNFANFNKFKERLKKSKLIEVKEFPWWRVGYESAYLSLIRLKQKNTVDSIFHSFRSVEGLLVKWLDKYHADCVVKNKIRLPREINIPWYPYRAKELNAHGVGLYYAFLELEGLDDHLISSDFKAFGEIVFKNRNEMFHNLAGAEGEAAVFSFWDIPRGLEFEKAIQMFEKRLLTCLNCISKECIEHLEDISLMAKVHQILFDEIISL